MLVDTLTRCISPISPSRCFKSPEKQRAPSQQRKQMPKLLLVAFEGFELLDAFGPLELLLLAGYSVTIAAPTNGVVRGGVVGSEACKSEAAKLEVRSCVPVVASHSLVEALSQKWDLLLVPGGQGTRALVGDEPFLATLALLCDASAAVASVCTGSALLAAAGVLDGRKATTNKRGWAWVTESSKRAATVEWTPRARWVADRTGGKLCATSSGVAAGLDMAVWLASDLLGAGVGEAAAKRAEYVPSTDPADDPFAALVK